MKIVFCSTVKNRSAHLALTLPKNLEGNPKSKFIVLDYGSDESLPEIKSDRVSIYRYEAPSFKMAHAKNMSHRLGMLEGADVLVNLDADNYLGDGFEDFVEGWFEEAALSKFAPKPIFLWSGLVKGLGRKFRGVSGRIAVTPAAFIKAGGYDEKYDTWAPDDKDFNARLCCLGYRPVQIDREYLEAIPHGHGMRFQEYPHAREAADGEEQELPPFKSAVVNGGKIGCGFLTGTDGSNVDLKPIPTRIFGIGMHKTATTSLHTALKILGYESEHWGANGWARKVWDEMRAAGVSPSLERFYAASDLPISLLYRELDKAYPGSKFILTIREEFDWLRSVRNHFSYRFNPYRWEWDRYPFSNRIHQALYGRRDFDATTMLNRYRKHNAEVRAYFKNRPGDLLVLDMDKRGGWTELCGFLQKPLPSVEYPRKFVTNNLSKGAGI